MQLMKISNTVNFKLLKLLKLGLTAFGIGFDKKNRVSEESLQHNCRKATVRMKQPGVEGTYQRNHIGWRHISRCIHQ